MYKQSVDVVKVEYIGYNLNHPIGLNKNDGANVDQTDPAAKKWFVLHPRNDIVHGP